MNDQPNASPTASTIAATAATAADRAIEKIGGVVAVSKLLKISPQAVSQWSLVPAHHAGRVAAASGISLHELRPDIFPPPAERVAEAGQ
jgi:DNA-binding transcriptional regulator YdaS (Cro superfamily)